jgi:hypothetical protein
VGISASSVPIEEISPEEENNIILREALDVALSDGSIEAPRLNEVAYEIAAILKVHSQDPYSARRAYADAAIKRFVRFKDLDTRVMHAPPVRDLAKGSRIEQVTDRGSATAVPRRPAVEVQKVGKGLEEIPPVATVPQDDNAANSEQASQTDLEREQIDTSSSSAIEESSTELPQKITSHARVMPGTSGKSPEARETQVVALHGEHPKRLAGILEALKTTLPGTSNLVEPEITEPLTPEEKEKEVQALMDDEARGEELQQKAIEEERNFFKEYIKEQLSVLEAVARQNKGGDSKKIEAALAEMQRSGQAICSQPNVSITDRINQIDALVEAKKKEYGPAGNSAVGLQPDEIIKDIMRRATIEVVTENAAHDAKFRTNLKNALEYKLKSLSVEHLRREVLASLMEEEYVKHKNFYIRRGEA